MRLLAKVGSFLYRLPGLLFFGAINNALYLCSLPSLAGAIAITVAAAVNYGISHALFLHWIIDAADMYPEVFQYIRENNLESYALVRADYHRLMKMKGFWPPHDNPVVTLGFSFGVYLLFTKVMITGADYSIKPINRDNSLFLAQSKLTRILNSVIAACFIFSVLFSSYRLGEMHFIVIGLNLVHLIVTFTCSNFVFARILRMFVRNEKDKLN